MDAPPDKPKRITPVAIAVAIASRGLDRLVMRFDPPAHPPQLQKPNRKARRAALARARRSA